MTKFSGFLFLLIGCFLLLVALIGAFNTDGEAGSLFRLICLGLAFFIGGMGLVDSR